MAKIMCAIKKNRENNLFPYDAKYTYVHDVCYFGETLFIQPVVDVYYCCRSTVFFFQSRSRCRPKNMPFHMKIT